MGALALSALLYVVNFSVGYALHQVIPADVALWPEGYSGFDNRRFFNQFQSWLLPLLVLPALLVPARYRWARRGLLGLAACW